MDNVQAHLEAVKSDPATQTETQAPQVLQIELSKVLVSKQVRSTFDEDELADLAKSIQQDGQRAPIEVTRSCEPGFYELLTGERRFRALGMLNASTVMAILVDKPKTNHDKTALQLVENIQREELTPLEIASAIHALSENGLSGKEIAQKTGKSTTWVSRYTSLNKLPDFIAELLENKATGDISLVLALHKVAKLDQGSAKKLASAVKAKRIGRKQIEDTLEELKSGKKVADSVEQPSLTAPNPDAIKYRLIKPEKFAAQVQAKLESGEKVKGRLLIDRFATINNEEVAEDWCWLELKDGTKACVKTSSVQLLRLNSL
ncbi:ParB/RepB/Spo0J family partition protein [Marinospirillum celere]|uniref:ParB/RepB/Spo0J family partition protein n=1 Tax=Marinospirillum celere TaxID=1122252 RepID=A0A1I1EQZ5_9GAMM|nr:ParB/RepB/Spo0J family partition protein [Marinospirillum celere]SFB87303.1 ParB/RepB/Spo0J family partition protein [Marinospirillum celere]